MTSRVSLSLAALLVLPLAACIEAPERRADEEDQAAKAPAAKAPAEVPANQQVAKAEAPKPGSNELTAEELELIEADPKTLGPEQNRKRAYALRKKIMQDPNSPAAQALEEARAAALEGQLSQEQIHGEGAKQDQGLVIELPEHLKNQDASRGEPAL